MLAMAWDGPSDSWTHVVEAKQTHTHTIQARNSTNNSNSQFPLILSYTEPKIRTLLAENLLVGREDASSRISVFGSWNPWLLSQKSLASPSGYFLDV